MINFRAFETLLDAKKEYCIIERYICKNEPVLKIDGTTSDMLRQKIKVNKEAILGILAAGWIVDNPSPVYPEWAIATRKNPTAILSWKIGCREDFDEWIPEYHQATGGLFLYENRADGQAWRTRRIDHPAENRITTRKEGEFLLAFDSNGVFINKWPVNNPVQKADMAC